ncbi:hypothetical protein A7X67_01100 [Clostridium sp. W14A]|nr:hypothetical protein A7X67_01100 [Clostridium sp. W14A]
MHFFMCLTRNSIPLLSINFNLNSFFLVFELVFFIFFFFIWALKMRLSQLRRSNSNFYLGQGAP